MNFFNWIISGACENSLLFDWDDDDGILDGAFVEVIFAFKVLPSLAKLFVKIWLLVSFVISLESTIRTIFWIKLFYTCKYLNMCVKQDDFKFLPFPHHPKSVSFKLIQWTLYIG